MPFYKDTKNQLHFLDDEKDKNLLSSDCEEITVEEADKICHASLNKLSIHQMRAANYPPITDFLDAYVKDDKTALKKYKDDCLAVKKQFPKD